MSELREGQSISLKQKAVRIAGVVAVATGGVVADTAVNRPVGSAVEHVGETAHSAVKEAADALFKNNDMRDKLMPDKQPSQEKKDASVGSFNEAMNPPTVPTLERPKKQY